MNQAERHEPGGEMNQAEPKPLRVAVIDDEPLVRNGILRYLRGSEDIEVVGEAGDGAEAIDLIERERPDLVFLDVQMPECDGFEVLQAFAADERPAAVFVTAYDSYALRAFDVHAVDYLLKPFDPDRFSEALSRARARLGDPVGLDELREIFRRVAGGRRRRRRLAVRSHGKTEFVDVNRIVRVEAAGNYARLHVEEHGGTVRECLYRASLEELVERFPERLIRIHRSALVAADRVRKLLPLSGGAATLVLADGTELRLSRSYREAFEAMMTDG